jgi:hypothetical protein
MNSASSLNQNQTTNPTPVLHWECIDVKRTSLLHYCTVAKDVTLFSSSQSGCPASKTSLHNKMHILVVDHFIAGNRMSTSSSLHK